jgi:hypothetical protein
MDQNHKYWNQQQQVLRQALLHPDEYSQAVPLFLSQHGMVHSSAMSASGLWSFEDEVWQGMSDDNARKIPGKAEHSIVWLFWHCTRIEDITMNILISGDQQVINQSGWLNKLGVPFRDTGNAMHLAEVTALSSTINISELREYRIAIGRRTRELVQQFQPSDLKKKVDPARINKIFTDGAVVEGARGLLDYWGGLTYAGLLLMPPTRHNFIHLNEALRLKHKIEKMM